MIMNRCSSLHNEIRYSFEQIKYKTSEESVSIHVNLERSENNGLWCWTWVFESNISAARSLGFYLGNNEIDQQNIQVVYDKKINDSDLVLRICQVIENMRNGCQNRPVDDVERQPAINRYICTSPLEKALEGNLSHILEENSGDDVKAKTVIDESNNIVVGMHVEAKTVADKTEDIMKGKLAEEETVADEPNNTVVEEYPLK